TLANPNILWDVGFQLSFAATLGLMIYIDPWKRWVDTGAKRIISPALAKRFIRYFGDIFIATLAAMLLTMPLLIYHFQQLSEVSSLANFFVFPAQPGVMSWGIIATVTGMVFPALGKVLAWLVWPFLTYTISGARFFAGLPAASIPVSLSAAGLLAIYALIFGLTWLGWKGRDGRAEVFGRMRGGWVRRTALTASAIIAVMAVAWALSQPDGKLHVSFLDVGQGDATLIQTPSGRYILIDGGLYPRVLNDHLGREIPFWDRDIDLVIATHPDDDHVAGLPGVLDRYEVGQLITNGQAAQEESYQALMDIATENAVPIHQARAGEIIELGDGLRLEILNPPSPQSQAPSLGHDNDQSVALRLVYGDFSLMLTGDAGDAAERDMLASSRPLSAVVYKAGHHGAKSSSGEPFLRAINPQYVIVSAGEGNNYGHPHDEVLERASDVGAAVMRTDELGTIEVITDGEQLWWEASRRLLRIE
ncbi:MAG: ComEC/Rec2 family competence protein, partial [Candidatus Promineifilaceae bacterium]